ncbi:hypothetical protein DDI_2081 [Dickeya dianthicola RNS04.9]|nr:hypothetical protein DDI_2081 [Dickeya dianthicola RNS04.9]
MIDYRCRHSSIGMVSRRWSCRQPYAEPAACIAAVQAYHKPRRIAGVVGIKRFSGEE